MPTPITFPERIEALVFDVDGTLYSQARLRLYMGLELMQSALLHPGRFKVLPIVRAYRRAQETLREQELPVEGGEAQLALASKHSRVPRAMVEAVIHEWFYSRPLSYLQRSLYPGVMPLLKLAKARGVRRAALSDYPVADKLSAMGIADEFDAAISSFDKEVGRLKPNPGGLRCCLAKLKIPAENALYIGDRADVDGACARNAGVSYVILGRGRFAPRNVFRILRERIEMQNESGRRLQEEHP